MSSKQNSFTHNINYIFIVWMNISKKNTKIQENEILLVSKRLVEEYGDEEIQQALVELEKCEEYPNLEKIIEEITAFEITRKYRILLEIFVLSTLRSVNDQDIQIFFQNYQFDMDAMTVLGLDNESIILMQELFKKCDALFLYQALFKIFDKNYAEADAILSNSTAPVNFVCFNNNKIINISQKDKNLDIAFLLFNIEESFFILNVTGSHIELYNHELSNFDFSLDSVVELLEEEQFLFHKVQVRNHSIYSFKKNTLIKIEDSNSSFYLDYNRVKQIFHKDRDSFVENFLFKHEVKNDDRSLATESSIIKLLQAENLSCGYRADKVINSNINFEIKAGEFVAIMGPSGAGKSTLMKTFIKDALILDGSLKINDEVIDFKQYAQKIGYVPQDDILVNELSVYDNLYYFYRLHFGDKKHKTAVQKKIFSYLRKLGIYDIKNSIIYKDSKFQISGGQRKRVNIAMELIKDVDLLLIDEPTSGLSSIDSEKIIDLLREIANEGKIIITVLHQPSSAMYQKFNQVILFNAQGFNIYSDNTMKALRKFKIIKDEYIYQTDDIVDYEDVKCPTCHQTTPDILLEVQENEKNNFWNLSHYISRFVNREDKDATSSN